MGKAQSALKACCKPSVDAASEQPPEHLTLDAAYAPSIPDSVDSQFRLASQARDGRQRMQMHDARLKRAPPSQSRAITVADFHHNRGLAAAEEDGSSDHMKVAASATTTLSSAIQIAHAPPPDEFAGMDENAHARSAAVCDSLSARRAGAVAIAQKKQDETFVDPELERILGAVLDRCYLLCHDREWKAWQAVGAVGGRGSYVYSRCQAQDSASTWQLEMADPGVESTMVIELEVERSTLECRENGGGVAGELVLADAVPVTAVRSVFRLVDFVTLARANRLSVASARSSGSDISGWGTSGGWGASPPCDGLSEASGRWTDDVGAGLSEGTLEAAEARDHAADAGGGGSSHQQYHLQRVAMEENMWMLEDFEELLTRRRVRGRGAGAHGADTPTDAAVPRAPSKASDAYLADGVRAASLEHALSSATETAAALQRSDGPVSHGSGIRGESARQNRMERNAAPSSGLVRGGGALAEAAERLRARTAEVHAMASKMRYAEGGVGGGQGQIETTTYPSMARQLVKKTEGSRGEVTLAIPELSAGIRAGGDRKWEEEAEVLRHMIERQRVAALELRGC